MFHREVTACANILAAHSHEGSYCATMLAHNIRAARNLAISMK